MLNNWKKYKFSDFVEINPTIRFDKNELYSFVEMKDLNEGNKFAFPSAEKTITGGARFEEDDTLFARITPCLQNGKICQVKGLKNKVGFGSTEFLIFRGKKEVSDTNFVYYLARTEFVRLFAEQNMIGTSGRQRVVKDSFQQLELTLPPLPEQQAIAEILSSLDDKIELNLQTNKTLEEMANALYKHWFVDFGPFKNGKFVESELGLIPEGWEVKKLGQLLSIKHGYAFKGNHFTSENTGKIVLTPGNFEKTGGIKFNPGKEKFYNADYPKEYELKEGQVIIALTDLTPGCEILGSAAIIIDEDQIYLHNQRLGLVQLVDDKFGIHLFFQIFNSTKFREFIKASRTGSTVSHTAPTRIYDFGVVLPKENVLKDLEENLLNFRANINHNIRENKVLVKTRDYLLPKLISGEIRVNDAAKSIKELI